MADEPENEPGTGEPDPGNDPETDPKETDHEADAKKWKALARKHEAASKSNAAAATELKKLQDAQKTAEQQATDKAADAEKRAASAERTSLRLEVALDKAPDNMSIAQVRKLAKRLTGDTREEMESDAEELFEDFTSPGGSGEKDEPDTGSRRRPREKLRSGAAPDAEPDETDPAKLAAKVPRPY